VVVLLAGAPGCSESEVGAVTDDHGREVELDGIPTRIVSHVPSITETLFALGLGDSVVGVSDFCNYPEEAAEKPSVGGYYTPSIEQIAALDPDLVLTDGYAADIAKLDPLGIPYVVLDPADIDGYLTNIELLGSITGVEDEAGELVSDIQESIDAVVAGVAGAEPPRVFYVFDATELSKPWTAGPGSFVDAFMTLAGGENVAGEAQEPWLQFSLEALVDADPEVILVDAQMGTATVTPEELERDPVWQETTAVKEGRISVIDGDLVNRHGPRMVLALEQMARVFHPDLFQ
jgi:iron complex transport system substrate-binding protein